MSAQQPARKMVLVVGECGDGKSTLVDAMRDPSRCGEPAMGRSARGMTKEITAYPGLPIDGLDLTIIDTPGIGDMDITAMQLVVLLEQALTASAITGGIDGVIVTTPITDGRVRLGAQVVQFLVDKGFVGDEKWANVILTGTKKDRATEEDVAFFSDGLVNEFFANVPPRCRTHVMVSKHDYSQLLAAIRSLPSMQVRYEPPPPQVMGEALAARLGIGPEVFVRELPRIREAMEAQARQIEDLVQRMLQQQERHDEDMRRGQRELEQLQRCTEEHCVAAARAAEEGHAALQRELGRLAADARRQERFLQELRDSHAQQMRAMLAQRSEHWTMGDSGPRTMGDSGPGLVGLLVPVVGIIAALAPLFRRP